MHMKRLLLAGIACLLFIGPGTTMVRAESWTDVIKISGDFRYRFENIQEDKKAERDRQRIRLRLKMAADLDDRWKTTLQLTTGGLTDPVSTNQTLGDDLNRKPIDLALAYVDYKPLFENLTLSAGKVPNPFVAVGSNQLIWDGDLTFDGISGKANFNLMDGMKAFANGAGFWVRESSSSYDPMVYAGQGGLQGTLLEGMKYTLGGSYYFYKDAKGQTTFVSSTSGSGNSTVTGSKYAYNYKIAEGFFDLSTTLPMLELPFTVFGNVVGNMDDSVTSGDTGYNAGFTLNKAKAEGSWAFTYFFRRLDRDAVVGAYSDSDFIGGGTNGAGHVFQAAYMFTDSVQFAVTHLNNQKDIFSDSGRVGYHRTQVDLITKF